MSAIEVGTKLVTLCNAGKSMEAVDTLYSEKIVSIEAQAGDALPQRMEGIDAVRGKSEWWYDNNEVHSMTATGPFCGHRDDQFVVKFDLDATPKGGERMQMQELGIYTTDGDKIVQEEFLFLAG